MRFDDPSPYDWDVTEATHTFDDGWTVVRVETTHDRELESRLFDGMACITGREWDERLGSRNYHLYSLRDAEGKPQATILLGDANFTIQARVALDYIPYTTCRQGDQTPRCLDGSPVIALQFCPRGHMAGDSMESHENTRRLKAWFEALPLSEEHEGYTCTGFTRKDATDFLKARQ